jgi:hypothetical protein
MANDLDPVVGNWYRDIDSDEVFRVVGVDDDEELISIQREDGDVEDIELRAWFDLDLEQTTAPEGWFEDDDAEPEDDDDYERSADDDDDDWREDDDEDDWDDDEDDEDDDWGDDDYDE